MNTFSRRHFIKTVVAGLTGIYAYYCVSNHKVYAQSSIPTNNKHILVIYYSLPESDSNLNEHRDNSTVTIDNQLLGNTQYMVMIIQATLKNADIFRIETVTPYDTTDHAKLIEQAKNELNNNYRPALKQTINNLDQYDTILFGYPIWWADLPTPVYSFLSQHDFAGKKVIPFGTHGGSGFANTRTTIAKLQPNADFRGQNGLTIYRDRIGNAKNEIVDWVNQLSLV